MSGRVATQATTDSLFPTVLRVDSFRAIIEGIESAILVADRSGRLLAANGAAKIIFGLLESADHQNINIFPFLFESDGSDILDDLMTGSALAERAIVICE